MEREKHNPDKEADLLINVPTDPLVDPKKHEAHEEWLEKLKRKKLSEAETIVDKTLFQIHGEHEIFKKRKLSWMMGVDARRRIRRQK